jgi:DNA-binding transcriptional LysR family regulator
MPELTRRRSSDAHEECWHIYWGDIRAGTIEIRSLRQCFLEGIGLGSAPAWLVQDLIDKGELVRVLPKWTLPSQPVHLVYPTRRHQPLRTRAFLQFMTDRIPTLPGFWPPGAL